MDVVTNQDLELLTRERTGMCVSLYLRTHPSGSEQDSMNLNNMLAAVQAELVALGMEQQGVRSFIRPARALVSDNAFWQVPGRGLALFLADGFFRSYRMPIAFDDTLVAADRFLLTPLLPLLTGETDHYLLVLSQSKIPAVPRRPLRPGQGHGAGSSRGSERSGLPGTERGISAKPSGHS